MSDLLVHCVIEMLSSGTCLKCMTSNRTEGGRVLLRDGYAMVSSRTPLSKLTNAILIVLGFPEFVSTYQTRGLILIDNWKALTFDQITDNLETPVGDLFKNFDAHGWILKIVVSNAVRSQGVSSDDASVDCRNVLDSSERSLDQSMSSIIDPGLLHHPFSYLNTDRSSDQLNSNILSLPILKSSSKITPDHDSPSLPPKSNQFLPTDIASSPIQRPRRTVLVSPGANRNGSNHCTPAERPVCRLLFDPLTELPQLVQWFEQNSHPTSKDFERYASSLNSKPYRRFYTAVAPHNIKIWFKNRRAKFKRMQQILEDNTEISRSVSP